MSCMRRALTLLLFACSFADAAEFAWPSTTSGDVPAPWQARKSPQSASTFQLEGGQLTIATEPGSYAHLARAIDGDGSDEAPLRMQCAIACDNPKYIQGLPMGIALYWEKAHAVSVGLGADNDAAYQGEQGWNRWAWSYAINGGKQERFKSTEDLFDGPSYTWLRIVVTSRDVSTFASRDGVSWFRLQSFERGEHFKGAPAQAVVGRGWRFENSPDGNDLDNGIEFPSAELSAFRFQSVSLTNDAPKLTGRIPPGYRKSSTWIDTAAELLEDVAIKKWKVLGPFKIDDQSFKPDMPVDPQQQFTFSTGKTGSWVDIDRADATDVRPIDLQPFFPDADDKHVCWAAATIACDAPRAERFLFDFFSGGSIYLNGKLVVEQPSRWGQLWRDQFAATAFLKAGDNQLVVVCKSGPERRWSGFYCRHEPLDPRNRIAQLTQMIGDFPDESEDITGALQEIPGLWEAQGCYAKAIEAWGKLLEKTDLPVGLIEHACKERYRLHQALRNPDGMKADIEQLAKLRLQKPMSDGETYSTTVTIAQQWQETGYPDKALEVLDDLAERKTLSADQLISVTMERVRLHRLAKQDAQMADDYRQLAASLPETHALRFDCQARAIGCDLAAGKTASAEQAIAQLEKEKPANADRIVRVRRLLAAYYEKVNDSAKQLEQVRAIADAGAPSSFWEDLRVRCAELSLAAAPNIQQDAVRQYQQAIAALGSAQHASQIKAKAEIDQAAAHKQFDKALIVARAAYFRGCLLESAEGEKFVQTESAQLGGTEGYGAFGERMANLAADAFKRGDDHAGFAIARAVLRGFGADLNVSTRIIDVLEKNSKRANANGQSALADVIERFDERRMIHDSSANPYREYAVELLIRDGELARAAEMLQRNRIAVADRNSRARNCLQQARLLRQSGYQYQAAPLYREALAVGIDDEEERKRALEALNSMRTQKDALTTGSLSIDTATALQGADKIAELQQVERAIKAYQTAIDEHANDYYSYSDDKAVGVAEYAADRIAALGGDAIALYRQFFDGRARELFEQAGDDPLLLTKLVHAYPFSNVTDDALGLLANQSLDRGDPERAAALIAEILSVHADSDLSRPLLLAQQAHAHALAGQVARARASLTALGKEQGDIVVAGKTQKAADYANAQLKSAQDASAAKSWPTAGGSGRRAGYQAFAPAPTSCAWTTLFPQHPSDETTQFRFWPYVHRHCSVNGVSDGAAVYFDTGDEAFAVSIATGEMSWRSGPSSRRNEVSDDFSGLKDTMTTVDDRMAYSRLVRHDNNPQGRRLVIEARRKGTGVLAWSTETVPALADVNLVSAPAVANGQVYAVAADLSDRMKRFVVGLDAATGQQLWRTPLMPGTAGISLTGQVNGSIYLGDHLSAPSVSGADLFISTDAGYVIALDAVSGVIRWCSQYAHAFIDPDDGRLTVRLLASRAASRVLVGDDVLYVLPRDGMSLVCLKRGNGDIAWQHLLNDATALIGLAPASDGGRLLVQGRGIECLSGATGDLQWRWQPKMHDWLHGVAALGSDTVYASTESGLSRIDLGNGTQRGYASWASLGVSGPIGNFILSSDRMLGFGDGRLVALKTQAGATPTENRIEDDLHSIAFSSINLPTADPSNGLAMRWHLGNKPGRGIVQARENPDEAYLVFDDQLVRFDAAASKPAWAIALPPGAREFHASHGLFIAVYPRFIRAYDGQSGKQAWTYVNAANDSGFDVGRDSGNNHFGEVRFSEDLVSVWRKADRNVIVLDIKTGKIIADHGFPLEIAATRLMGDELCAMMVEWYPKYLCNIEVHDARDGVKAWKATGFISTYGTDHWELKNSGDGRHWYVCGGPNLIAFDAAAQKELWRTQNKDVFMDLRWERGRIGVTVKRNFWDFHFDFIDPQNGKLSWEQLVIHEGGAPGDNQRYRHLDDKRVLSLNGIDPATNKQEQSAYALCRDVATGQVLWRTKTADQFTHHALFAEKSLIVLAQQRWVPGNLQRAIRYQVIDTDDGASRATGVLPGSIEDTGGFPAAWVHGQLIYGSQQGFYGASGTSGAQADQDGNMPELEKFAAKLQADPVPAAAAIGATTEFIEQYRRTVANAAATEKPIVIDGQLDDWAGIEPIALDQWHQARALPGGSAWKNADDCSARIRCAWDRANIYLSAEVIDDDQCPPARGADGRDGDSLLIGIDPEAGGIVHNDDSRVACLQAAVSGGQSRIMQSLMPIDSRARDENGVEYLPRILQSANRIVANDEAQPRARVARTLRGYVYEIAIPWAGLRDAQRRPGDRNRMGLDFAVIDWDANRPHAAIEWGGGMVGAIQTKMFHEIQFIGEPK